MGVILQPDIEDETEVIEPVSALDALPVLMAYAEANGDISQFLSEDVIGEIEAQVLEQYRRDKESRSDWHKVAQKALEDMSRTEYSEKTYPWPNASNVHYPLLQQAVQQFWARTFAAIIKGDEAARCKVLGEDKGLPAMIMTEQGPMPAIDPQTGQVMQWQREPGAKTKRALRVSTFLNYQLFYAMENWEGETSTLIYQLSAVGCAFRKTWFDGEHKSLFVPATRLVVDNDSKTLESAPQITEEIDGVFPHHIRRDIATGKYRPIDIAQDDKDSRLLLEVQCYYDLDGDGIEEPYIVTLDHKEGKLLRVVPDFGEEDVKLVGNQLAYIERRRFYTKYEFLPHPEGKFYNNGLAHTLDQHGSVINTLINQMLDANHAATAGGGFVASGLRIQGKGQNSSLRWRPGEYKTVSASGEALRSGIVERTFPQLSPVIFNLLEFILGAGERLASINDVMTGDASNNGQVGTTLALIEQGLQVFNSIYKLIYLSLKTEFSLLFKNIGTYGDEQTAALYMNMLDDMAADFAGDFSIADMDIRPISDPTSVTKMQKMARAQFLLSTVEMLSAAGGDVKEALRRVYEAADVEDIDKLLPPPDPAAQQMQAMAAQLEMGDKQAGIADKQSKAALNAAKAQEIGANVQYDFGKLQQDGMIAKGKQDIADAKMKIEAFKAGSDAVS